MVDVTKIKSQVNDLFDNNILKGCDIRKVNVEIKAKDKPVKKVRTYVTLMFGPKIKK